MQFPFANFAVKLKTTLINEMSLYNNIMLSFETSRQKRTHLKLKQNKTHLYKNFKNLLASTKNELQVNR